MKSTWDLFKRTTPFIWARLLAYLLFAVGSVVLLAIVVGLAWLLIRLFEGSGGIVFFFILVFIGGIFSLYRLLERYVLYLLKAAHIAVLIELIDHGEVPDGKGQIAYGKERVTSMFGTTSAFFAIDQLVMASVKQIHRWLMRIGDFLNVIPGAKYVISIVSMILGIALNYIDEAVLSRVMKYKKEDENVDVWKTSADGIVLYAQSWKSMIATSAGVAIFTILLTVVSFLIVLFPLLAFVQWIAPGSALSFLAYVSAATISLAVKKAFVDPVATISMIRTYHTKTAGVTPRIDLKEQMVSVSRKFRELVSREGSGAPSASRQTVTTPNSVDLNT